MFLNSYGQNVSSEAKFWMSFAKKKKIIDLEDKILF